MWLGLTLLDWVALAWFLLAWFGYTRMADDLSAKGGGGLNQRLQVLRRRWAVAMMARDNRIVDAQLIGHSIHSATFFASTTILIIAGLVGAFGGVEAVHRMLAESGLAVDTTRAVLELKLLALLAVYAYGFIKFTWSIRQFNYLCVLIGAVPEGAASTSESRARHAEGVVGVLSLASHSYNAGLRSYYFALAMLGWFFHPGLFLFATAWAAGVLLWRQTRSPTLKAISDLARE